MKLTNDQIKKSALVIAREENISMLDALSALQSAAAKLGSEDTITQIHKIKMQLITK